MKMITTHRWSVGRSVLAFSILTLSLTGLSSPSGAQPLEDLRVGVTAVGASDAGLLMAKDAGFFKDQGLNVEFVFFPNSVAGMQALVAGQMPVVAFGGVALIHAVLAGAEIAAIAELMSTLPYTLVVLPEIARPADLKGKRLAINRYGTIADVALRFALTTLGLDPKRDVTMVQMNEQSLRLAALQSRSIDGTVISPPGNVVARKLGFRELIDVERLGWKHPTSMVVVSKEMIQKRPETLRRVLTAVALGTQAFKTRRDEGIQVLRKYLKIDDGEVLAETYAVFSKLMNEKPYGSPEGMQMALDEVGKDNPRAKTVKPQDFFDMRFVRELDEGGLFTRLYKR